MKYVFIYNFRDESPVPDRSESDYLSNVIEVKKLKELILQRDNEISILSRDWIDT